MSKASVLLIALFLIAFGLRAQLFKKKINQYDKDGLRTGLWKTYWDDDEKIPMSIGHFEKGRETGICKEFLPDGTIRLKSRYHGNKIRMKYYNEDRRLEKKGWALIDYSSKDIHFYWHGKWKYFEGRHHLVKTSIYTNGEESLSFVK